MEPVKKNLNESGDNSDEESSTVSVKVYDERSIDNDDEEPTVSVKNINELKVLDFYSADDVRQAMKSALTNKVYKDKELPTPKIKEIVIEPTSNEREETHKANILLTSSTARKIKEVTLNANNPKQDHQLSGRKRQGRPIKTGPSKSLPKRCKIDDFYIGKLSNFVPYKRRGDSESDFDSESGVLY